MKNKSFQLLSAIGIILVVFGHSKNSLLLFGTIFPFYSFHMALFAFISGYFIPETSIERITFSKAVK